MEYNRAELKRGVRLSMKMATARPMLVTLLFMVAVSAGTWLINTVLGWLTPGRLGLSTMISFHLQAGYELEEAVEQAILTLLSMGPGPLVSVIMMGMVTSILAALWQSAMNVGYEGWCLSMVRDEDPPMNQIFGALSRMVPVLITRFLTGVFMSLWGLLVVAGYGVLFLVVALLAALTESEILILLLILVLLAYLVLGMLWVSTRYALVDYVLLDRGLSGMEALRENKRLMKGNIGTVFQLQLSFAGWYLLVIGVLLAPFIALIIAAVSMGPFYASDISYMEWIGGAALGILGLYLVGIIAVAILGLWLKPYVTGTIARFYDWTQGRPAPSAGGFGGTDGGWGQYTDYTWSSGGGSSGSGMGPGGSDHKPNPPKPRDDPWN